MTFADHGCATFTEALNSATLDRLERTLEGCPDGVAGVRLPDLCSIHDLIATDGAIGTIAARHLGPDCRAVRAILFDKSEATNWGLGWHQDRTIAVAEQIETPGFGPWSRKSGIPHVEPPIEVLQQTVTLRVHLDDVDHDNAPLLVSPGSHRLGRIAEADIDATVASCGTRVCLAKAGDVWAYATLILHASEKARIPRRRRVLQLDYSAAALPNGLRYHVLTPASNTPAGDT